MNLQLTPGRLRGRVTPPASKSQAHRALIAAMLSPGACELHNLTRSEDIDATRRCMGVLRSSSDRQAVLDCGESGSTLRFLMPVALALRGGGVFTGRGRLMERPQGPYFAIFDEKGIFYRLEKNVLTLRGLLPPGEYRLPGNVSSQFVTGLLFALPLLGEDSEIVLTSPLESRGYVDMTVDVLGRFGIRVENRGYERFIVPKGQNYRAAELTIEGDWSQGAFWYAAKVLGSEVEVLGLHLASLQGDRVMAEHCQRLAGPGDLNIDVSDCPDLVPPLAVTAAVRRGTTRLTNAARLRMKESDRLLTVRQTLSALGASVEEGADSLTIRGLPRLAGGVTVDCCGDHRIAMMAAVAAAVCERPIILTGAECVAKSYPGFWEDYRALGGIAAEIE